MTQHYHLIRGDIAPIRNNILGFSIYSVRRVIRISYQVLKAFTSTTLTFNMTVRALLIFFNCLYNLIDKTNHMMFRRREETQKERRLACCHASKIAISFFMLLIKKMPVTVVRKYYYCFQMLPRPSARTPKLPANNHKKTGGSSNIIL